MGKKSAAGGRFAVEGALTIRNVDAAHLRLREVLEAHKAVEIDLSAATELDLSAIQLLLAARTSARKSGKKLALKQPVSDALRHVLLRAGFLNSTAHPGEGDSFWLQDMRA